MNVIPPCSARNSPIMPCTQLLWQAGERGEAAELFESSLDVADRLVLLHHRTKLAGLGRRMGIL